MLASFLKRDLKNLIQGDASPNFQAQNGLLSLRSWWRSVRSLMSPDRIRPLGCSMPRRAPAQGCLLMITDRAGIESRPGRRASVHPATTVRQVATDYPACRDVFRRHGEPERISVKFGRLEPLDRFAQRHGVPLDTFLAEMSGAAGASASIRSARPPSTTPSVTAPRSTLSFR